MFSTATIFFGLYWFNISLSTSFLEYCPSLSSLLLFPFDYGHQCLMIGFYPSDSYVLGQLSDIDCFVDHLIKSTAQQTRYLTAVRRDNGASHTCLY